MRKLLTEKKIKINKELLIKIWKKACRMAKSSCYISNCLDDESTVSINDLYLSICENKKKYLIKTETIIQKGNFEIDEKEYKELRRLSIEKEQMLEMIEEQESEEQADEDFFDVINTTKL